MKRLLSLIAAALVCIAAAAADYVPNTKWPYVYENFAQGTVYSADRQKSGGMLNIHLSGNVLHYIDKDGRVRSADNRSITRVEIGQDAYIVVDGRLMQVLSTHGDNVLLKLERADFGALQGESGGAYGASLNSSSSRQLTSIDLGGLNTPEHGTMLQEKNDGREIPVKTEYYFAIGGKCIEATKSEVQKLAGESRKAELAKFLKEKKLKWKNPDSLALLLAWF